MDDLYINIGSAKCCLFVKMSSFLISALNRKPLLYYAVEEALECEKIGYYGIGIITFSQLLNLFRKQTPPSRHLVAHEVLKQRPAQQMLQSTIQELKMAAAERCDQESRRHGNRARYQQSIIRDWEKFIGRHHRK